MIPHPKSPVIFGPVPSRRLGRSLGIKNVSPKQCSYSCIYYQIGKTKSPHTNRATYFSPEEVYKAVGNKIETINNLGSEIDYLTFVPPGEPALDENLDETIKLLKNLSIKIAIISNASIMTRENVKKDFLLADYISLKVDTLKYETWVKINRPSNQLKFKEIIQGVQNFRKAFQGTFVSETMLVRDVNDSIEELEVIANFISELNPNIAFLTVPIRPPAEHWVKIPDESKLINLFGIFECKATRIEYLIDHESSDFGHGKNDIMASILDIARVHPVREEVSKKMTFEAKEDDNIINELVMKHQLTKSHHKGKTFYLAKVLSN